MIPRAGRISHHHGSVTTSVGLWSAALLAVAALSAVAAEDGPAQVVTSPDGCIAMTVHTDRPLGYDVTVDGKPLLVRSRLGLELAGGLQLGEQATVERMERRTIDERWENRFGNNRHVRDHASELRLTLRDAGRTFAVIARAYDNGVAFRYELPRQEALDAFVVERERTTFAFPDDATTWAGTHATGDFHGAQEWEFPSRKLSELETGRPYGMPLLLRGQAAYVALTESDLLDWSGLWLDRAASPLTLEAVLAPRPDGKGCVNARTPHASPWRVLLIGRQPADLIGRDLVLNLATPNRIGDTSWIRPGMMAWDHWWSGDIKMDTATLKSYIQLAADMGWPYQLVDWQWYGPFNTPQSDITRSAPSVDLPELLRFARERNVRLWLWMYNTDVDRADAYKEAFPLYEKWGIAGVKIDFMDRDDQDMVNWYEKITKAAAEHHLMVDFHGAYKPTGLERTYPNQVTREGVLGNEYNKFSPPGTRPEHKATLPFTRMLAGPADFTPGGFLNRQPSEFQNQVPALVQGTRANELAVFVIYPSPIVCACDAPEHYKGQPGADFLKVVPTVWDETRGLAGEVGRYVVVARRCGPDWFLGAITDREPRGLAVPLNFLGEGAWKAQLWEDTPESGQDAEQLSRTERTVRASETLTLKLAPAGGAAVRISPAP